jgi:YesN/AraC family two-component response regulator
LLEHLGYRVTTEVNSTEALRRFSLHPNDYDLVIIITDLIMPGKEGLEMISYFKRNHPDAKIVAMSGGGRYGYFEALRIAKSFGASEVLPKPFERQEMLNVISQILDLNS